MPYSVILASICLFFMITPAVTQDNSAEQNRLKKDRVIENPYCEVSTYTRPAVKGAVRALMTKGEGAVIIIDERILVRRELTRFLLAHECCHHSLGHVEALLRPGGFSLVPKNPAQSQRIELDADCCAARALQARGDRPALENAKQFMIRFGPKPTGFGYPTGIQRGMVIRHCSLTKSNDAATIYLNEKSKPSPN